MGVVSLRHRLWSKKQPQDSFELSASHLLYHIVHHINIKYLYLSRERERERERAVFQDCDEQKRVLSNDSNRFVDTLARLLGRFKCGAVVITMTSQVN